MRLIVLPRTLQTPRDKNKLKFGLNLVRTCLKPRSLDDDLNVTCKSASTLDWQRVPFVLEDRVQLFDWLDVVRFVVPESGILISCYWGFDYQTCNEQNVACLWRSCQELSLVFCRLLANPKRALWSLPSSRPRMHGLPARRQLSMPSSNLWRLTRAFLKLSRSGPVLCFSYTFLIDCVS